jgi:phage tail-like protein
MTGTSRENPPKPYMNFKFQLSYQGKTVAGFSQTSRLPSGRTRYEPITLERGVTHDVEFEQWANKVSQTPRRTGGKGPPVKLRKEFVLEQYTVSGERVNAVQLRRCWISAYQALPELDAGGNAVAIEMIKLEYGELEWLPSSG